MANKFSLCAYHTIGLSHLTLKEEQKFSVEALLGVGQLDMERPFFLRGVYSAVLVVSSLISSAARDEDSLDLIYH